MPSTRGLSLILASQSPRRRQLLGEMGFPVEVVRLEVDEHVSPDVPPDEVAERLACRKAGAFPASQLGKAVLVAADTVVLLDGKVLGKPASREEAVSMLRSLSGRAHRVRTGVCLRSATEQVSFTEESIVHFSPLDSEDIAYYVDRYRPYDKAGAYGIQEWIGMVGVSRIEGCFYNVMGLPVARLYSTLKQKFLS